MRLLGLIAFVSLISTGIEYFFDTQAYYLEIHKIIPWLFFIGIISYWLFVKRQIPKNILTFGWISILIGAVIWDHPTVFLLLLLVIMPGLLFIILNRPDFNRLKFINIVLYSFPIVHSPLKSFRKMVSEMTSFNKDQTTVQKTDEEHDDFSVPMVKTIGIGIVAGILLLLVLVSVDTDFAQFIKAANWLNVASTFLIALIKYIVIFYLLVWHPLYVKIDHKDTGTYKLSGILKAIVVTLTAVIVGYTIYDLYIIMRITGAMNLMFETIGSNTQAYFLEMIAIGGSLLFVSSFLGTNLFHKTSEEHQHKRKRFIIMLAVTSILLIPPIINLFRVFFIVYIPEFGLSARRLFGIYTAIAFIVATCTYLFYLLKSHKPHMAQMMISFFLTLLVLTTIIPSNYLIFTSQLDRYLQGKNSDFNHVANINLAKTTWMIPEQRLTSNPPVPTDLIWQFALYRHSPSQQIREDAQKKLYDQIDRELYDIKSKVRQWNYRALVDTYGDPEYLYPYEGQAIEGVTLFPKTDELRASIISSYPLTMEKHPDSGEYVYRIIDSLDGYNYEISYINTSSEPVLTRLPSGRTVERNRTRNGFFKIFLRTIPQEQKSTIIRLSPVSASIPVIQYSNNKCKRCVDPEKEIKRIIGINDN